jgi:Ca2+-transporting ATPase
MGGRGTDVAREAASIVLLDDDFGSIVRGIRVGRRIYDNLRKAMGYIFAIHVPIAGLALLPVIAGWPLLLTPILIALFELIIDPACSVVLEAEPEEAGVMQRPPRPRDGSLLPRPLMVWCLVQGAAALAVVVTIYVAAMQATTSADSVRTMAFLALVGANIALIFVNRTFATSIRAAFGRPNRTLWWGLGIVAVLLTIILVVPEVRRFFGLEALHAGQLLICLGASVALLTVLELAKRLWRRRLEN